MIEYIKNYKYHIGGILFLIILMILFYYKKDNNTNNSPIVSLKTEDNIDLQKDFNKNFNEFIKTFKNEIKQSTQEIIKSIHEKTESNQIIKFKNENFTKDIVKKNILIDSITAIKNNNSYNSSNYTINFGVDNSPEVYKNVIGFRLIKATVPHVIHTVTENNKRIDYSLSINGADPNIDSVELTPEYYTFDTFISHLIETLNTIPNINFINLTTSTDSKYTISWEHRPNPLTQVDFNFLWKKSLDNDSSSYLLVGDNPVNYTNLTSDYTFPHLPNQTRHSVDLIIPEIPNIACKISPKGKNIIDRIPLNTPSGTITYYRSPEGELQTSNYFYPMKLSSLNIQLHESDSNNFYDSQNGNNYFEFEITIVENTKYFK